MKFSENWLRARVDLSGVSHDDLVARLTAAGLEVEDVAPAAAAFSGVVVAKIVSAAPHPDAQKLQLCSVDCGPGEPVQIVCGAPNARAGLIAPLARVGAVLPDGLVIAAAQLRGVDSFGMLCSAKELGLSGGHSGLLELPASLTIGMSLRDALDLDDHIIELKLTPNRADCLSIEGLARELGAIFDRSLVAEAELAAPVGSASRVATVLQSPQDCPRYLNVVIDGIDPSARSPDWLVQRLQRSGIGSIHPVVDITNYVMLETGQPMHAFDRAGIQGDIVVRRAFAGESLTLLDGNVGALSESMLLIADDKGPLAVAGVMGGHASRVTEQTTSIVFEAAHFQPATIMGRARALGLHTDSSHRFERGVDPNAPQRAIARATALALAIVGGTAGPLTVAEAPAELPARAQIVLRKARLRLVLGVAVPDAEVLRILLALGLSALERNDDFLCVAPSFRFDLAIEADLIEEVARLFGYDRIPASLPRGELIPAIESETQRDLLDVQQALCTRDYHEAITMAFVGGTLLEQFGLSVGAMRLVNPLSADIDTMRPSLLPGLVGAALFNARRQQPRVRLFEVGAVWTLGEHAEVQKIGGVALGPARAEHWSEPKRALDYFDVAGDVTALGLMADATLRFSADDLPAYLHPGRSARVWRDQQCIGFVGQLHPAVAASLDAKPEIYVFELDLPALLARPISQGLLPGKFPSVRRDLALVVAETVRFGDLLAAIKTAGGAQLADVNLFDVFRGGALPEGSKSVAISLIFQASERTLKDSEVDGATLTITSALTAGFAAQVRAG